VGLDDNGETYHHPMMNLALEFARGLSIDARANWIRSDVYRETSIFVGNDAQAACAHPVIHRRRDSPWDRLFRMASLLETVTTEIGDAMRKKDQASLAPLRMLKAAIMNKEVEKGRSLDEAESLQVVNVLVKQRRDSAEQFSAAGRQELADRELSEIRFLERYLPPAADAATVNAAIDSAIAETGAAGAKDMGKVMKAVMAKLAGMSVDGRVVSDAVKKRLV
jgi:uncharacterized protein YqeY